VAPEQREKDVMAQLTRPAFRSDLADISLAFIAFNSLQENCDALCKFGEDHTIVEKIARHYP
jgi:type II restriction enzyme